MAMNSVMVPYAHERVTTLTSSKGLTAATYSATNPGGGVFRPGYAVVTVEVDAIRYTTDGTTPTVTAGTALGHLALEGAKIELVGYDEIVNFRAINAVASNGADLRVTYYHV